MADRIGDRDQTTKGGKSSHATRKVDTKLAVKKTAAKGKLLRIPINLRDLLALRKTLESSSKKITLNTTLLLLTQHLL
ncbi:unnamed protein product [Lactuca virosa]|uniref:Histone H2A C-terminal domain-containing protein n=1 Tax=Lactuca virosa TaxID=75947 RepID=A0AAU9PTT1_9ASTR|nr:unnamed protein product [Lactuca virosa]